jgi:hypothetical protein
MRLRATKLSAIGFGGARLPLPSLDLQFAADKTLTARKGPTPTFTRASGATQVNAAGLIEYAPENLILFSNSVTSPAWTKEGGTAATSAETVNGLTATVFNENSANSNHRFYRLNEGLAGISSTFSVWLKAAGRRYVCVNLGANGPTVNSKPVIDLVDRVVVVAAAGVTINIQLEANGWARYSFTFVPRIDSGIMPIQSNFSSTAISETGVGLNGAAFYVAGQQYERFSSARTYLPTTTSATYSPRFDHDPVTFACKGLLIEEARTNLFQYSEIFNEAASSNYWDSATANAVTSNQTTSPDGAATADLLTTSTTSFDCFVRRTINWVGSTQYSYSIFLKRGPSNHRYVGLYIGAGITGALQYPYFDFDNPTTVQIPSGIMVGTINSTRVDAYPNGWYRVSVTFTTAATPVTIYGGVYVSSSNGTLQTVNPAGDDCYIWGIQGELGAFPTSYIPTTTTTLTRSADVCSYSSVSSFYNSNEGTLVGQLNLYNPAPSIASELFRFGSGNERVQLGVTNETGFAIRPFIVSGGVVNYSNNQGTSTVGTSRKTAIAFAANNAISCFNGTLGTQDTSVIMPAGITTAVIGASSFTGHIVSIRYFKKRLPDAKLQALTS